MKIQILGTGCSNCNKLYELTKEAVGQLNLKEKVEHLTGQESIQKIIEMGVMSSPVLAIDGKAVMTGFIPNIEKIKKLILEAKGK